MNILHLTPDFNYGDGRSYYVYLLLKYLKKSGLNVILFTNGGDSFDRIENMNIHAIVNKNFSFKFSFIRSANILAGMIEKYNIDVIHSHHRYYELIALAAAGLCKRKVQTVFTALSIVDRRYTVEYKSAKIIAVSRTVRDMLINKFKVNRNRILVIPNFVDSEDTINSDSVTDVRQDLNILCIGRFHKEKDQLTLLKAVALLKDKHICLTLIGEGKESDVYENFISGNSINAKIIHPLKDLDKYYSETDICVLPSVRDPFPGFMLQSGLHKKPFIGSDTDGIAELIVNERNGLLFRKRDENDLSEKISIFAENKVLADKCRMNLFDDVSKKYTDKQIIPEIIKLYEDLLIKNA